jgi:hypothetical protein
MYTPPNPAPLSASLSAAEACEGHHASAPAAVRRASSKRTNPAHLTLCRGQLARWQSFEQYLWGRGARGGGGEEEL